MNNRFKYIHCFIYFSSSYKIYQKYISLLLIYIYIYIITIIIVIMIVNREGYGVEFYLLFLVRKGNVAYDTERCFVIIRYLFQLSLLIVGVWERPCRIRWGALCDQWILWMAKSIACWWCRTWAWCPLVLVRKSITLRSRSLDYEIAGAVKLCIRVRCF